MPALIKRLLNCLLKGLLTASFFLLPFFLPCKVFAETFDIVAKDTFGLISAINQANTNNEPDTINLSAESTYELTTINNDTYSKNGLPVINSEITINGNGSTLTRNSADNFRILAVVNPGSVTLNNILIKNGFSEDPYYGGGGILNLNGSLFINQSQISNNITLIGGGGGIWAENGSNTIITGSSITNNSGGDYEGVNYSISSGGAITKRGNGILQVIDSIISGNFAKTVGGAIYSNQVGEIDIINSNFSDNKTENEGGAIFNVQGKILIETSTFTNNASIRTDGYGYGGAIRNNAQGNIEINSTHFSNNTAGNNGGFLFNLGDVQISNSCIQNNSEISLENRGNQITASNNFWGAADGPSGAGPGSGDSISGNVSYVPFLTSCLLDEPPAPEVKTPIVLLPGLGASWDTSAMLTGGAGDDWKLTPFVKVYDNFKNTFIDNGDYVEGQDYFEYYYDWRQPLDNLADQFKNYLETIVLAGKPEGTKANLVGHSMGGLLAKSYAQKYGLDKVNKIVTAGSPHQGAVTAWQVWTGAEQGDPLSWGWLALELYLQLQKGKYSSPVDAVHGLAPSVNNLMPTFDFAKRNGEVVPVNSMTDFNNYLNDLKNNLAIEVKNLLYTLAGREDNPDKDTRRWVNLVDRNLADKLLGKWIDGKPESYESIPEGDLTVLELSALVNDATGSATITSEHTELLSNPAGIQAVLNAFGLDDIEPSTEIMSPVRNPSLVFLLHSPAQIKVTAPNGSQAGFQVAEPIANAFYSEIDKLLIIYNAESGDYQTEVIGTDTGDYELEIGQLTEKENAWTTLAGQTSNGENDQYLINFNADNPNQEPLIDNTGKTQVNMAALIFNQIKNQVDQLDFGKKLNKHKNPVLIYLAKINGLILEDLTQIQAGRYDNTRVYTRSLMAGAYNLRQKIDVMAQKTGLDDATRSDLKNQADEAGKLLIDAYSEIFPQSGETLKLKGVNKHINLSWERNRAATAVLQNVIDKPLAGDAYQLSLDMLNQATEATSSSLPTAWAKSVISRILALEATKLID